MKQVGIQFIAAAGSAALAFAASLVMVKLIDVLYGFVTDAESEIAGLDQTEHGETGFDFSLGTESVGALSAMPKAATFPPDGKSRFSVLVEGIRSEKLATVWSDLCQPGKGTNPDFLAVYPKVTSLQGNRFRFVAGSPEQIREQLAKALQAAGAGPVKTVLEK